METYVIELLVFWTTVQLTRGYDINLMGEDKRWYGENSEYQPRYGKEWVFFPDGYGTPHFVDLTMTEPKLLRSQQNVKTKYRLYIREFVDYISLDQSAQPPNEKDTRKLLSSKPIKLVTHGWISSADDDMVMKIKNAYLKTNDVAVIAIDWSDTAQDIRYPVVVKSTRAVGILVGQFLDAFCKLYNVSGDRLHLIGHSLGAHVMGVAASTARESVGRVTGLDPAGPLYEYPSKKQKSLILDSSDADFVDVIHSCSGALGMESDNGHADIYPNNGVSPQPGCESTYIPFVPESCSHSRAQMYYIEAIHNPTGFPACRAENWEEYLNSRECKQKTYLGESINRNASGRYYSKTNAREPFATNLN